VLARNSLSYVGLLVTLLVSQPSLAAVDPVVAQRGTDRITLGQARGIVAALDAESRAGLATPGAITNLLQRVLLQRAILVQAASQHWDQRSEVVAALQQARDLTLAQNFLAAQTSVPEGYPAEADITAAYEQNKPRFMQPRSYHLEQLFLAVTQSDSANARRTLAELGRRLPERHGLHDVAKQKPAVVYADLGWLPEAQIAPDIRTIVTGLQEGAVSDPVCTPAGCHLIRLVATRPAGPAPLSDVRIALVRALRQQKVAAAEQAYANALLARMPVQVNELLLAQVTAQ